MLDSDLAEIYEVEVGVLKRAVRRNIERFPSDFMFELSKKELENLRCQFGISSLENDSRLHGGIRYMPFVFTVLHTQRAFIQLRKQPKVQQLDWISKFEFLERGNMQCE